MKFDIEFLFKFEEYCKAYTVNGPIKYICVIWYETLLSPKKVNEIFFIIHYFIVID